MKDLSTSISNACRGTDAATIKASPMKKALFLDEKTNRNRDNSDGKAVRAFSAGGDFDDYADHSKPGRCKKSVGKKDVSTKELETTKKKASSLVYSSCDSPGTWEKNLQEGRSLLGTSQSSKEKTNACVEVLKKTTSKKKKKRTTTNKKRSPTVEEALGAILVERILDLDSNLEYSVSLEEWEVLLALPLEVMQDILWNIEYHEDNGLDFNWKGVQSIVLSHQLGVSSLVPSLIDDDDAADDQLDSSSTNSCTTAATTGTTTTSSAD